MQKIIKLIKASQADEINCADGELAGANFLFEETPQPDTPSGDITYTLRLESPVPLPEATGFLAMLRDADGTPRPLALPNPHPDLGRIRKAVVMAGAPVLLADGGWDAPRLPAPYALADTALPVIAATIAIGKDDATAVLDWLAGRSVGAVSLATQMAVADGVRAAFAEFVAQVRMAGKYLSPVRAVTARRLPDGTFWQPSPAVILTPPVSADRLTLAITGASCTDGYLRLSMEVSRPPFTVVTDASDADVAVLVAADVVDYDPRSISVPFWLDTSRRGFALTVNKIDESKFAPFSNLFGDMRQYGVPENIFGIDGRLIALFNAPEGARILFSRPGMAMVCESETVLPGVRVSYLTDSLRSGGTATSVGGTAVGAGNHPLVAFCGDGIRTLTPRSGAYRDVQLLSREVALSFTPLPDDSFAPLPDGTAFLTTTSLMKLSGTTLTPLSSSLPRTLTSSHPHTLTYLSGSDALLLRYEEAESSEAWLYSFANKTWHTCEADFVARHY